MGDALTANHLGCERTIGRADQFVGFLAPAMIADRRAVVGEFR